MMKIPTLFLRDWAGDKKACLSGNHSGLWGEGLTIELQSRTWGSGAI